MRVIITVTEQAAGTLVRVDGWLAGEGVEELARVVGSAPEPVHLLVHELRGADAAGLSILGRLASQGVALGGLSPYLQLMLANAAGPGPRSRPPVVRSETPVRREDT